ncbi:MAG: hypothetical protein AAF989_01285, partial [Planctomycetota bacterium]
MKTDVPSPTNAYAVPDAGELDVDTEGLVSPMQVPADKESISKQVWRQFCRKRTFLATVGFAFGVVALQMGQGILLFRLLGAEGRGEYATTVLYVQMLLYVGRVSADHFDSATEPDVQQHLDVKNGG